MGGGLMQLVAYGAQDIYLSGNPQITFFKVVYRRHTNFSMESIEQTFNGTADFGRKVTCTVSRNGDLINRMYMQVELPAVTLPEGATTGGYLAGLGHKLVKSVEIEIGGQRIDKHYGDWLHIWNELTQTEGHWDGYSQMINGSSVVTGSGVNYNMNDTSARTVYIPLQFWFCRNPGLALPLIALQYHEVKINIEFSSRDDVTYNVNGTDGSFSAQLFVDYIYLDTDERRRFAQVSHEYLIEQLQFTGDETANSKIKLNFNHPVKELIWVEKETEAKIGTYVSTYNSAQISLNSHERFSKRKPMYFQLVQPYQHHERVPDVGQFINVYSFALKPEEHQPSGTCNMSRIDNATLTLEGISTGTNAGTNVVKVFAVNYNVLRIMSGMGGLAYSN
jgi:hypothetical protein